MTYPSFSHEQRLPSLKVTKELVKSLEQYLLKCVVDAALVSSEEALKLLSVEVEDSNGSETVASIEQVPGSRFADSTSRVEVVLRIAHKTDGSYLRVRLYFSRRPRSSTLAISATMPNARGFSLGLKEGLFRILDPEKTWHWIAHPTPQVWAFLFAIALFSAVIANSTIIKEAYSPYLLGFSLFIWLYTLAMPPLRRYTCFDSRAAERADENWKWFIYGIAGFLLFGTLLTLFRRQLLGF
jgi:hypothetical protein